jgi:hypothetical protein
MNAWANCRNTLTHQDFTFAADVLTKHYQPVSIEDLVKSEEQRDELLDHESIYFELKDNCSVLRVSPPLYFYILSRKFLKESNLDDRDLADYVASILIHYGQHCQKWQGKDQELAMLEDSFFPYVSDLMMLLQKSSPAQSFQIHLHLANYCLYLSGIFQERVQEVFERRGGPDLDFYENIGQSNYSIAADHRLSKDHPLKKNFESLSNHFSKARHALNRLTEETLHLDNDPGLIL